VALAIGIFSADIFVDAPITANPSAWYFGSSLFVISTILVLAIWGFRTALSGQRVWKTDIFR